MPTVPDSSPLLELVLELEPDPVSRTGRGTRSGRALDGHLPTHGLRAAAVDLSLESQTAGRPGCRHGDRASTPAWPSVRARTRRRRCAWVAGCSGSRHRRDRGGHGCGSGVLAIAAPSSRVPRAWSAWAPDPLGLSMPARQCPAQRRGRTPRSAPARRHAPPQPRFVATHPGRPARAGAAVRCQRRARRPPGALRHSAGQASRNETISCATASGSDAIDVTERDGWLRIAGASALLESRLRLCAWEQYRSRHGVRHRPCVSTSPLPAPPSSPAAGTAAAPANAPLTVTDEQQQRRRRRRRGLLAAREAIIAVNQLATYRDCSGGSGTAGAVIAFAIPRAGAHHRGSQPPAGDHAARADRRTPGAAPIAACGRRR